MIVYPMGLPPHDPIKQELENTEDLSGTQVRYKTDVLVFYMFIMYIVNQNGGARAQAKTPAATFQRIRANMYLTKHACM